MDGSGFTLSRVSDVRRGEKEGKFSVELLAR